MKVPAGTFLAMMLIFTVSGARANDLGPLVQSNSSVGADCRDFRKMPDGRWRILRSTQVSVGAHSYSAVEGYLSASSVQSDGLSIYRAVEEKCRPR